MVKRTITGIVMAGFLFLIIWLTNYSHFIFDAFVFIVGVIATYEIFRAVNPKTVEESAYPELGERKTYKISLVSLIVMLVSVYPLCYFFNYVGLFFAFLISLIVAFVIFIFDSNKSFNDFAVNVVCIIYPMLLLSITFILNKNYGMIPVLLAIGISTVSDATAYFVGSAIGKKKIFPKISPKKTYAGCIGGVIGGGVGGIIVYLLFE